MLSIDVQDDVRYFKGTGFLMQHSMPNTPFEAVNAWKKEKQNFIPNENDHNVNVKSQHMFCFSVGKGAASSEQLCIVLTWLRSDT
jgi:hypothetical protein